MASKVEGTIVGRQFVFYCVGCRHVHVHGIGKDPSRTDLGNRGSHCFRETSPFYGRSYDLTLKPRKARKSLKTSA